MKQRMRKAGLGLLVGAVVVLGGGFASADYQGGDSTTPASAEVTVTYTIQSFRAIELSSSDPVPFNVVRQGEIAGPIDGPTILYGTTWPTDKISAYLDFAMKNGVKLYVSVGTPTPPLDGSQTCTDAGDTMGAVTVGENEGLADLSSALQNSAAGLINHIDNCGAPGYADAPTFEDADLASEVWATASTAFVLDATSATDTNPSTLSVPQMKVVTFIIDGAA